jgi:hypothetical protein
MAVDTLQEAPGEEINLRKDVTRGGAETSLSRSPEEALGWALDAVGVASMVPALFLVRPYSDLQKEAAGCELIHHGSNKIPNTMDELWNTTVFV